jgi:hypothetical protein
MDPEIIAIFEMINKLKPEQLQSFLKLGGRGGGAQGGGGGEAEGPPNVFGGGELLSDQNLLYTGGQGQPGAQQFAPQSYKGAPTFTGGVPYPPSEYEKIHAIMSILNNLGAGLQTMEGGPLKPKK